MGKYLPDVMVIGRSRSGCGLTPFPAVAPLFMQGYSSVGRALVTKARGCEFESRYPCTKDIKGGIAQM